MNRKQRIDKMTKDLKATRVFSTLVDEIKAIPEPTTEAASANTTNPRPVLLFMGGGMGAGKSTVLKEIMKT